MNKKSISTLAIIIGIILSIGGIIGYITIMKSGQDANMVAGGLALMSAFGMKSELSFGQRAQVFLFQNRNFFLFLGIALVVIGVVLKNKSDNS